MLRSYKCDLNKNRSRIRKITAADTFLFPFSFGKTKDHCISYWSLLKIINPLYFVVEFMNLTLPHQKFILSTIAIGNPEVSPNPNIKFVDICLPSTMFSFKSRKNKN